MHGIFPMKTYCISLEHRVVLDIDHRGPMHLDYHVQYEHFSFEARGANLWSSIHTTADPLSPGSQTVLIHIWLNT